MYFRTVRAIDISLVLVYRNVPAALTFSKPQNLSLPSARIGPASSRCFSRGVIWGVLASFFEGDAPEVGLDVPYESKLVSHVYALEHADAPSDTICYIQPTPENSPACLVRIAW